MSCHGGQTKNHHGCMPMLVKLGYLPEECDMQAAISAVVYDVIIQHTHNSLFSGDQATTIVYLFDSMRVTWDC